MVTKTRAKRVVTKAELLAVITQKTDKIPARFQPMVRRSFLNGLKYKTKPELKRIASRIKVEVDSTGYDIHCSKLPYCSNVVGNLKEERNGEG